MSNSKKTNKIRYWYVINKITKTIKFSASNENECNLPSFETTEHYATYSYLKKELALIAIMDYINRNNLEDLKFIK